MMPDKFIRHCPSDTPRILGEDVIQADMESLERELMEIEKDFKRVKDSCGNEWLYFGFD